MKILFNDVKLPKKLIMENNNLEENRVVFLINENNKPIHLYI